MKSNNKYEDYPTKNVFELAKSGDREACLELSHRFTTGTVLLKKDDSLAEYWKNKAEEIEKSLI